MNAAQTQAKAIVAGILTTLLAGASSLATVLTGDETLHSVTTAQWLAVLIAMLTAGGSVYGITWSVTNAPPKTPASYVSGWTNSDGSIGVSPSSAPSAPAAPVSVPAPTAPAVTAPSFDQVVYGADGAPATPEPAQDPNAPATPAPTA